MAKTNIKIQKFNRNLAPKHNKHKQKKKQFITPKKLEPKSQFTTSSSPQSSASDSEFEADRGDMRELLEPYSKDQLIDLIIDFAVSNPALLPKIQEKADKEISHRKIFIHGLSWDTTNESLASEFKKHGEIESCNVILDRNTGKARGYAFITYFSRESTLKALDEPRKSIKNRIVYCNLASLGPAPATQGGQGPEQDGKISARKIYVTNVTSDVNPEKLRSFFAKFGEIESGPTGFDANTGKFKGYALFLYKTVEGAKKALEEPDKLFEGRQLHCEKATEVKKIGGGAAGITVAVQSVPPVIGAMAASDVAVLGQNSNLGVNTPVQNMPPLWQNSNLSVDAGLLSGLLTNPDAVTGLLGLSSYGSLMQLAGVGLGNAMGMGIGGYNGEIANQGFNSLGSSFGSGSSTPALNSGAGSSGMMQYSLMRAYPNASIGQISSSQAPAVGDRASLLCRGIANQDFSNLGSGSNIPARKGGGGRNARSSGMVQYGLLHAYPNTSIGQTSSSSEAPGNDGQTSVLCRPKKSESAVQ